MKVKCIKILEGGRRSGKEIPESSSIHVGGEYVVLGLAARSNEGVDYLLLRDGSETATAVWPSEMFEITSGRIPSTWRVTDPYGTGVVINVEPEPWLELDFWQRKEKGDQDAFETFRRELTCLLDAET